MISINEDVYVYGGRGEVRSSNVLWRYNIGTQEYTQESRHGADFFSPQPTSYHVCFEYQETLLTFLGINDYLGNPTAVNMWNFENKQWSIFDVNMDGRSRVVADLIGTDIVYIGGDKWNIHTTGNVNAVYLNDRNY